MSSHVLQTGGSTGSIDGHASHLHLEEAQNAQDGQAQVRVLSYNFNILPRGCGGFQNERIDSFLKCVNEYDVLLFQEVYAATVLPYFLQRRVCYQKRFVDELKERGFTHYVISRQPSYPTILRENVHSDNGLIIASRFPIEHCGSHTFDGAERGSSAVRRGCLFAEVMVPAQDGGSVPLLLFNVHLREAEGAVATSAQVMETRRFIDSVIGTLYGENNEASKIPLVVAGDFNVNGIGLHDDGQPAKPFTELMQELQPMGGGLSEVILETLGHHPPTRPSRPFFPSRSKLNRDLLTPQRQDFFFVTPAAGVRMACIRKFVASSRRPYVYLSDHFGVSATLGVSATQPRVPAKAASRPIPTAFMPGGIVHQHSNPLLSAKMEFVLLLLPACAAMYFNSLTLCGLGILWFLLWWFISRICVLSNERQFATVTRAVVEGKEAVRFPHPKEYDSLHEVKTIAEMWQKTVCLHSTLRCLGQSDAAGRPEWLTYAAVEAKVRELGSGLCALGLAPGDVIGVDCQANRNAVILELACATYGFTTMTLVGKSNALRTLIDGQNVKVVFASRNAVASLLTCRSRNLETVVNVHSFQDAEDEAVARDVGITLLSYDGVCYNGRLHLVAPPPHVAEETVFSLAVDTATTGNPLSVVRVTHADVLRDVRSLVATAVLPNSHGKQLLVQFAPFSKLFNRVFILGLFAHGSCVATSESATRHAFATFRPTIMLASPSLFATSEIELKRRNERYGRVYTWLFEKALQIRSVLINVHCRDSSVLRFLFFRAIQRKLGGHVEKIVLCVSEESVSCRLQEHIAVCYSPCTREVFFMPSEGVFCVDGLPAPGIRVELGPLDGPATKATLGQLTLVRDGGRKHALPIAAKWNDNRTLRLMGPPGGILLPSGGEYVVAAELERLFAQSRYVNDIFLYARPSRPIIAIVTPNRDTVEFEWQQQHSTGVHNGAEDEAGAGAEAALLNWTELSRYASGLLLADFRRLVNLNGLHASQVPGFVHLHPHPFLDHEGFLTAYAGVRRECVAQYFKAVIERCYSDTDSHSIPTPSYSSGGVSSDDDSAETASRVGQLSLRVPVTIDIGGSFAKFLYVKPPGHFDIPDYLVNESSSLSDRINLRTFKFFAGAQVPEEQPQAFTSSTVGTVRFAKLPSKRIPDFIAYLEETKALNLYGEEYRKCIRATGGGAFKYAALAKKKLDSSFQAMREMDAVVQGLVLVIRLAPSSIFTVDPPTGIHYPHKLHGSPGDPLWPFPCLLVNIGSGISIIKCLGPDGSHVRVGGSPIGGATFWGLVRTMTDMTSWEEVLEIMRLDGPGDNKNVDLLVGDIYGYNAKDLPAMLSVDTVASTFGKFGTDRSYEAMAGLWSQSNFGDDRSDVISPSTSSSPVSPTPLSKWKKKACAMDIVRSLLNMISSNVTQLAYLHSRVQNVQNIFFAGGFVRENPIIWSLISATLQYWSKGECHAHFLEHDGYLGVLGSATMSVEAETAAT
ncbi:putative pantothenate kinase subunit [Trypanosoma conorhini]|uniref:Putative pantothenate kinase subunit n=1 Tax=Trypanosoma conorhini TaxID=83891 RepID=A0A3R7RX92_9TRYP|nr:putative pantothenate kinase subunit [Trypanosoma conorhini]RNF15035.1 putative pantothenate kinase subunit [Trypanosoma conorhini]